MQRREKKEWHWSQTTDVPPNATPCHPAGWSTKSGNIHEEDSGVVLWDVFCMSQGREDSAVWTRRLCAGTYSKVPEGQWLGKRKNRGSDFRQAHTHEAALCPTVDDNVVSGLWLEGIRMKPFISQSHMAASLVPNTTPNRQQDAASLICPPNNSWRFNSIQFKTRESSTGRFKFKLKVLRKLFGYRDNFLCPSCRKVVQYTSTSEILLGVPSFILQSFGGKHYTLKHLS